MPVVASLLFTKGQDGTGILKVAKEQLVKEMKCKKSQQKVWSLYGKRCIFAPLSEESIKRYWTMV